jgi:outer membrane protein OmpA-like peptidoglycan-associated protein/tetratricopeptide (TPR) repeat protein
MKSKFLILIFALSSTFMIAQERLADKFFSNYGYVKATELYQEVLKKGDTTLNVLTRLGDCYYNNSNSEKAAFWYAKAFDKYGQDKISPEYMYKYIQSLRSQNEYEKAEDWMAKFMIVQNDDSRTEEYNPENIVKYDYLNDAERNRVVTLKPAAFNSANSDFGAYIKDNMLYFASARNTEGNKIYGWNDEPFLDLYQLAITRDQDSLSFGPAELMPSEQVNSKYHEASLAITNDGKTMYFTRDNMSGSKRIDYDKKGTTHLKLYKASLVEGQWESIIELPFNDISYSNGHPALSPDNKKLYFVSDREGGFGKTDIYVVDIKGNDSYGEPQNLGAKINTEGREMFPYVSQDSTLYFSSDGRLNLGFLDIFKSNLLKNETAEPVNMGAPYNSSYDDFAYFNILPSDEKETGYTGYFSSNRPGGNGSDDIYMFDTRVCYATIKGFSRKSVDNTILPGVTVQLIDEVGKVISEVKTGADGAYEFEANCNYTYTVLGTIEDHKPDQISVTTTNKTSEIENADLFLEPLINDNQIVINPIFFDFDKAEIRTDAQYELENIVDVLRAHPKMIIRIESHTDSRGRDYYNMKLSDRRAKATEDYILSRGIAEDRVESAIGFGETQLLNECSNDVKCTEEQHQLNRRSYFYILKDE